MRIILEGPDLAGKTTLAKRLAKETRLPIFHKGPPQQEPLFEYEPQSFPPGIYDRFHLGEVVYGPILRGGSGLAPAQLLHVQKFLESRGAITVVLLPSFETITERYKAIGDDMLSFDQITDAYVRYNLLVGSGEANQQVALTNASSRQDIIDILRVGSRAMVQTPYLPGVRSSYVGPFHPDVVIVNVANSGPVQQQLEGALPPVDEAAPGTFILDSLRAIPRLRTNGRWGMMNLYTQGTDIEAFYHAWVELGRPHLIALGRKVHDKIKYLRIPHSIVSHPNRWSIRPPHVTPRSYGEVLLKAFRTTDDLRGAFE